MMMNITQDYFDELCIENYEMLFCMDDDNDVNDNNNDDDISNNDDIEKQEIQQKETQRRYNETVNETIEQLQKLHNNVTQTQQQSLLNHITLTYPQSIYGIKIRHERNEFQIALNQLKNSKLVLNDPSIDELILHSIDIIQRKVGVSSTYSRKFNSQFIDTNNNNNTDTIILDDDDDDNDNNNINNNIMYQNLFIVEDGFNVFWSVFEICVTTAAIYSSSSSSLIDSNNVSCSTNPTATSDCGDDDVKNKKMMMIAQIIIEIFNELLVKKKTIMKLNSNNDDDNNKNNVDNSSIRSNINNKKEINEKNNNGDQLLLSLKMKYYQKSISNQRCIAWLHYYQYRCQKLMPLLFCDVDARTSNTTAVKEEENNMNTNNVNGATITTTVNINNDNNKNTIESIILTLISLLKLAYYSCRKCEMNKNVWMNILQKSSSIDNDNNNDNNNDPNMSKNLDFITLLLQTISIPVANTIINIKMMDLKIHVCQLITVLCTFDEFNSNNDNNNSMVVQSSHQNVLRFYESNIISILLHHIIQNYYDIFIEKSKSMLLTQKQSNTSSNDIEANEEDSTLLLLSWIIRTLSSGILTLRSLAIQDDVIKSMLKIGLIDTIIQLFIHSIQHQQTSLSASTSTTTSSKNDSTSSNNIINNNDSHNNNIDNTKCDDQLNNNDQLHEIKQTIPNQVMHQQSKQYRRQQYQDLITSILGLLRNLAANDEMKCIFCQGTKLRSIDNNATTSNNNIVLMYYVDIVMKQYIHIPLLQEHSIGLIGSVALRQPMNCTILIKDIQIHESILHAMEYYPNYIPLQRQGALAIRNLVSRNPELRSIILGNETGSTSYNTEYILRHISSKHIQCQDEVYSALRDLGLSVSSIHIERDTTTGEIITIQKNRQMFGDPNSNTNFRPVY